MIRKSIRSKGRTLPNGPRNRMFLRTATLSAVAASVLITGCDLFDSDSPTPSNDESSEVLPPAPPEEVEQPIASDPEAEALRTLIGQQVGDINTLMVPATDFDIPLPLMENGEVNPMFDTTEEKRYLGKQLFHDPVRSVRIVPEFGGITDFTSTASCGSCHLSDAGSKAGQQFNFAVGGEGIGFTDASGEFVPRRRPRVDIAPRIRDEPLFDGDPLVDFLPTLTDVYDNVIGSPALSQLSTTGELLDTGRLDSIDSVSRNAPSVVGTAFNNRLLLDGFAGEADASDGGLNPGDAPAQENLTLLLLDAHRNFSLGGPQGERTQGEVLKDIPAFVQLFRDAFPQEAAMADDAGDLTLLVNDPTIVRATATFLRTVVTRNTPWDKFLAGDNEALTQSQQRGAELFFTPATDNAGGAGCFGCHSGPMLNKQPNDPDVAGVGEFVEENFFNLGLGDHPLQALVQDIRNDPEFRDTGRAEITGNEEDDFKFRSLTLRQLKDSGAFMHSGEFNSIQQVVEYFNAGMPSDDEAGETATPRFTYPRGEGSERGLGLSEEDVLALTDFLENALHDEAFVTFDPDSTTDTFQLNDKDVMYSVYRPDLADLGAPDGLVLSGLGKDNNDPLSRRDQGLEFLDVTLDLDAEVADRVEESESMNDRVSLTNNSDKAIDTHLLVLVENLPDGVELSNAEGISKDGNPFVRVFLDSDGGTLQPGNSVDAELNFTRPADAVVDYNLVLQSGQGTP